MTAARLALLEGLLARIDDEQTDVLDASLARLRALELDRLTTAERTALCEQLATIQALIDAELAGARAAIATHDAELATWSARADECRAAGQAELVAQIRERCDEIVERTTAHEALLVELERHRAAIVELAERVANVRRDTECAPK